MTKAAQASTAGAARRSSAVACYSGLRPRSGGGSQIFGEPSLAGGEGGGVGGAVPGGAAAACVYGLARFLRIRSLSFSQRFP